MSKKTRSENTKCKHCVFLLSINSGGYDILKVSKYLQKKNTECDSTTFFYCLINLRGYDAHGFSEKKKHESASFFIFFVI